jgi:hypothetical protein
VYKRASLSGSWSGAYNYGGHAARETVFNAQIEEVAGAFVGATQEPNAFLDAPVSVLRADIEGVRSGSSVIFTKFYDHSAIRHAIRYEGVANADLTRIEGRWTIRDNAAGTFFMARDDDGAVAEAEEHAAVAAAGMS